MAHDTHDHATDAKPAFIGLILGAIVLFAILSTIVKLTNQHYAGEKAGVEAHQ